MELTREQVERFNPPPIDIMRLTIGQPIPQDMYRSENGGWVRHDDYAALRAKLGEMTQAVRLAATCVPSMAMDSEHPIEMMGQVCAAHQNLALHVADLTSKLEAITQRVRTGTQSIIDCIGANGPENLEDAIVRLTAKVEATEAECASWRKVLEDERAHAQQRLEVVTQERDVLIQGGVTEELLRRQDGYLKVGKGCVIVRADDYSAMCGHRDSLDGVQVQLTTAQATITAKEEEIGRLRKALNAIIETNESPAWLARRRGYDE